MEAFPERSVNLALGLQEMFCQQTLGILVALLFRPYVGFPAAESCGQDKLNNGRSAGAECLGGGLFICLLKPCNDGFR